MLNQKHSFSQGVRWVNYLPSIGLYCTYLASFIIYLNLNKTIAKVYVHNSQHTDPST